MNGIDRALWWLKQLVIAFVSAVFLFKGIQVLVGSYGLDNPYEFIMYFFSSSLLILVSGSILLYPLFRIHERLKAPGNRSRHCLEDEET